MTKRREKAKAQYSLPDGFQQRKIAHSYFGLFGNAYLLFYWNDIYQTWKFKNEIKMEIAYVFGACVVIGTIILIYNLIALKHEKREAGLE